MKPNSVLRCCFSLLIYSFLHIFFSCVFFLYQTSYVLYWFWCCLLLSMWACILWKVLLHSWAKLVSKQMENSLLCWWCTFLAEKNMHSNKQRWVKRVLCSSVLRHVFIAEEFSHCFNNLIKRVLDSKGQRVYPVITDTINYCHVAVIFLMQNLKSPFTLVPVATQFCAFQESKDVETEWKK